VEVDEVSSLRFRSTPPGRSGRAPAGVRVGVRGVMPAGRVRAAGVAGVLVVALCGCVGVVSGGRPAGGASGPAGGSVTPGAGELEEFAVRQAYEEFWWVASRIDRQPRQRWRGVLSVVAVDPELGRQVAQAADRAARGVHRYGELVPHVSAVQVLPPAERASAVPGAVWAVVVDGPDGGDFGEAQDGTGRVLSAGRPDEPVVARLVRGRQFGPWQVAEVRFLGGRCGGRPAPGRRGQLGVAR
jgi:hypothetical protein